jgi:predicted PurR-regulated permease PerM
VRDVLPSVLHAARSPGGIEIATISLTIHATIYGLLVVSFVPGLLGGNRLKLHTALAFMSVVGGLLLFGPAGIIPGAED